MRNTPFAKPDASAPHETPSGALMEDLLTVEDVAHKFKVPTSWIYERTRARGMERIPFIKLGKYLRFEESALRSWLQRHRRGPHQIRGVEDSGRSARSPVE